MNDFLLVTYLEYKTLVHGLDEYRQGVYKKANLSEIFFIKEKNTYLFHAMSLYKNCIFLFKKVVLTQTLEMP